jgi:hypothetical protein
MIPTVVAHLNDAHSALDQPPRHETVGRKRGIPTVRPVEVEIDCGSSEDR